MLDAFWILDIPRVQQKTIKVVVGLVRAFVTDGHFHPSLIFVSYPLILYYKYFMVVIYTEVV